VSIPSILFACFSSIIYFAIFYQIKELSKTHDWIINIGVPCLIAATLLLNFIKDKIAEKDPNSKLHKLKTELDNLKSSNITNSTETKTKHDKEISDLRREILTLQTKINLKDTIILGIKNSITTNLVLLGSSQKFHEYVTDFVITINTDLEINTLTPTATAASQKYVDMLIRKPLT
jgi:hypothetical protein